MKRQSLFSRGSWAIATAGLICACNKDAPPPSELPVLPETVEQMVMPEVLRLSEMKGSVTIERDGKKSQALEGSLRAGDVIETGQNGATVVKLSDGREVQLNAGSRLAVSEQDGRLQIQVLSGSILSRVSASADAPAGAQEGVALAVLTPEGLTRIVGLGEVVITVDGTTGKVAVDVMAGAVEFVDKAGSQSQLAQGDKLLVDAGKVEILARGATKLVELAPVEILLRRSGGARAAIRKAGAKGWTPVRGETMQLAPGDSLRADRGRSTIELGSTGSRIGVEGGSELTLVSAGNGPNLQQSQFDLRKGAMAVSLGGVNPEKLALPGLTVASAGGGQFMVRKTAKGYEVEAMTGDLELDRNGVTDKLPAGNRANLSGAAPATVAAIERAAFSLPPRSAQRVFHSALGELSLTWEPGERSDFKIEVSDNEAFKNPLLAGVVHSPFVNVAPPVRGALYWRVRSADGTTEVASGSAIFAPDKRTADLALLRNEVPEDAEKTTIFFQDKPPALTFVMKPEEGAAKYKLALYRANALTQAAVERTFSEPRAMLEAGVLQEGAYVWSATPLSADGKPLRSGRMTPLELVYDNAVPTLVVLSPEDGQRMSGRSIEAAGIAPMGSRIYVNGQAAPLDDKHRFRVNVAPLSGPPSLVVFKMAQPGGPDVFRVRKLRRGR